jgi:hypothetical protein
MRSFRALVSLFAVPLFVATASATVIDTKVPIPELAGGADTIVVGKATKIQPKQVQATPTARDKQKETYQIVEIKVSQALLGAKGETTVKAAVQCTTAGIGTKVMFIPTVPVSEGQNGCWFLRRHHSGKFYVLETGCLVAADGNADFKKDVELTKKCVQLLAKPDEGLKSKEAADRYLTAALLIRKYRGPQVTIWGLPNKEVKEEPIAAEQSKLILKALAEDPWKTDVNATAISPWNLFQRLGLTAKDDWKFKQEQQLNFLDAQAVIKSRRELAAAAKEWLKGHADDYRIKRIVGDDENVKKDSKSEEK